MAPPDETYSKDDEKVYLDLGRIARKIRVPNLGILDTAKKINSIWTDYKYIFRDTSKLKYVFYILSVQC